MEPVAVTLAPNETAVLGWLWA